MDEKTKKEIANAEANPIMQQQYFQEEDYNLKLLSDTTGLILLVSEIGQVFWVKKTKDGQELVPLNKGRSLTPPEMYSAGFLKG